MHRVVAPTDPVVSRRTLLAGLAALGALPLAACASSARPAAKPPAPLIAKDVVRFKPDSTAPVADVTAGMTAFAHALARANAPKSGNWTISPLSIVTAFAMARIGALGATGPALDRFFGFPATGRDQAFNAILQSVITATLPPPPDTSTKDAIKPKPPIVCVGNALFPRQQLTIEDAFLRTVTEEYGAGVHPVDFGKDALAQINAWVKVQTAGRIPVLFDSLDPSTSLVLANTVYLKASWQQPFIESPTVKQPFTRADGSIVQAPTMSGGGSWRYASQDGWAALELPFVGAKGGGALTMLLILPPAGGDPVDMLTPAVLTAAGNALSARLVEVALPTWNFGTTIDLSGVLTGMGLRHAFADGDYEGIAHGIGGIGGAIHRANITVNESGTEAAAATGLAFVSAARIGAPTTFRADRPYAFAILSGPTRVPLFSGVVHDPLAS